MSTLEFYSGSYNRATGTLNAFGGLSDELVAEGFPPMRVASGDRERNDQIEIFTSRYRQQTVGSGPYGDVRYWDGSADGYPGTNRWVRYSPAGTAAAPDTSDHQRRRANDLAYPYNDSSTAAHRRARSIAPRHQIDCDGLNFGEAWHWRFYGDVGVLLGGSAVDFVSEKTKEKEEEEEPMNYLMQIDPAVDGGWYVVNYAFGTASKMHAGIQLDFARLDPKLYIMQGPQPADAIKGLTVING